MSQHRDQITEQMFLYAERLDAGDFEGVARVFEHGRITSEVADAPSEGYDGVLAMYQNATRIYPETGTPRTQHVNSNIIITLAEDEQTATARSRFTVFQQTPELPLQAIICGTYHDQFHKVDGQWRFKERKMLPTLLGDLSQHLLFELDKQ